MNMRDGYDNAVGLDEDVKTVKKILLNKDHPQQIFTSILGESGVGKKALLQAIFKDTDVVNHFEITFGLDIPSDFTTEDVLQDIYKRASEILGQHQQNEGIDILDKLRHLLEKKRYLVVFINISSKTVLNCVRASLPDDNNGSRVLLVLDTESEEVAWHANTMNKDGINGIHMLRRLDEKRSGELFYSMAYRKEVYDLKEKQEKRKYGKFVSRHLPLWWKEVSSVKEIEEMSKYGKIVYDITGGYPLAIVLLAGLLRFKEQPGQWEAVLQQLWPGPKMEEARGIEGNKLTESRLSKGKHSSATLANQTTRTTLERVFWASFEDLPDDLKSCFLYFVAFTKHTKLPAELIVQLWMAEGFIKPQQGKTMEELGHNYLKELVLRCLVQNMTGNTNNTGIIEDARVHPSIYGLLHSEAREAGFIDVHDMHDIFVRPSVRRLAFISFQGAAFTNKFSKLRSFICMVKENDRSNDSQGVNQKRRHDLKFLCGSKFLRVIYVCGLRIKELPNEIGDMVHLRFLAVTACKDLNKLPSTIKNLPNLQTLDIRGTQVEEIHPSFWKIKTLRHVRADALRLPASIKEELDQMQTLWGVKPAQEGEWDQGNCPLHMMTKLRTLAMRGLEHSKHGAALENALGKMSLLQDLALEGDEIASCVFTAQNLRYIRAVSLRATSTIKWPEATSDVCKIRPNLVELTVFKPSSDEVPQHIQDQLQGILDVINV